MKVVEFQAMSYSSRRERRGEKGGENTRLICRGKLNEAKARDFLPTAAFSRLSPKPSWTAVRFNDQFKSRNQFELER